MNKKATKGGPTNNYTGNRRGEVVTGVMVVIMCVMMLFGGMHVVHGGHGHAADQDGRVEDNHDHHKEGMHHPQANDEKVIAPGMKIRELKNDHPNLRSREA